MGSYISNVVIGVKFQMVTTDFKLLLICKLSSFAALSATTVRMYIKLVNNLACNIQNSFEPLPTNCVDTDD